MEKFPGPKLCLINAQTPQHKKKMLDGIAAGEHMHVLLRPEQTATKAF